MGVEVELQTAIFDALSAGLVVPVYDEVPQEDTETDIAFPYVTIGETDVVVETVDTNDSFLATTSISVWSRYRGRLEVKTLQGEIFDILHRNDGLTIAAPYTIFGINFIDSRTLVDPDGVTRQGLSTFEFFIDTPQEGS